MFLRTIIIALTLAAGSLSQAQEVAPPPLPPSPVEPFRQWLEMPAEQREKQLVEWPEEKQRILRAKLEVYERLALEERERRLAMLDLRYYLGPLLAKEASPDRERHVSAIPEKYRETVRARLEQWDRLPAELKRRMIENELALQYLTRLRRTTPPMPPGEGVSAGPDLNPAIQNRLRAWQSISPEERRSLSSRLHEFFQLPREERQKTLQTLSPEEQQEIQRSLEALNRMPSAQRQACIQSFGKLATMSPPEQILFLHNAARWQTMTRDERETWKNLVHNLPPLPPGETMPPWPEPNPPLPPTAAVTNSQRGE